MEAAEAEQPEAEAPAAEAEASREERRARLGSSSPPPPPPQPSSARLSFSVRHGKASHPLSLPAACTVGDLRAPLKDLTGIPTDLQSLVLCGILLEDDDATLSDAGVTEGCRLMLVGSDRGVVDRLKQEDLANACKEAGNESLKAGRLEEAIASYSEAVEICPSNHVYLSNRSAAYLKRGLEGTNNSLTSQADFTAAAADARRCIELAPDFVKGYGR